MTQFGRMPLINVCSSSFADGFETAGRLLRQLYDCKGRKVAILEVGFQAGPDSEKPFWELRTSVYMTAPVAVHTNNVTGTTKPRSISN